MKTIISGRPDPDNSEQLAEEFCGGDRYKSFRGSFLNPPKRFHSLKVTDTTHSSQV